MVQLSLFKKTSAQLRARYIERSAEELAENAAIIRTLEALDQHAGEPGMLSSAPAIDTIDDQVATDGPLKGHRPARLTRYQKLFLELKHKTEGIQR